MLFLSTIKCLARKIYFTYQKAIEYLEHKFNDAVTRSRFSVQSSLRQSSPREKLLDGEKQSLPWSSVSCHRKNFNQIEGSKAL